MCEEKSDDTASGERAGTDSEQPTTIILPALYCVICGAKSGSSIPLCGWCGGVAGRSLPLTYSHEHRYHCTFCRAKMDRYYDFTPNGDFKSDNYLCTACEAAQQYSYNRAYLPKAVSYLEEKLKDTSLPLHIRWSYTQHLHNFSAENMVS